MSEINLAETKTSDSDLIDSEVDSMDDELDITGGSENGGDEAEKSGRKHGRSFIYLTLEDAEKAARRIDEHERRMTKNSFAQALGHPKPIGRFKQKLAALESYELVTLKGDDVQLTELAVEMLYGPNEAVRTRAKAKAFLSYDLFKKTFVECPKNQDHQMSYVDDFVRVTLKIVNERDMFLKRFLESAKYAGLLEGEADPKATTIRLRPAVAAPTNGESAPDVKSHAPEDQWVIVPSDDIGSLLDGLGLSAYQQRCDVSQRAAGEIAINMADGKITVEVRRPVRMAIRTTNMLEDVTDVLKALQSKGFKA